MNAATPRRKLFALVAALMRTIVADAGSQLLRQIARSRADDALADVARNFAVMKITRGS
jgi:hypothetical protein